MPLSHQIQIELDRLQAMIPGDPGVLSAMSKLRSLAADVKRLEQRQNLRPGVSTLGW